MGQVHKLGTVATSVRTDNGYTIVQYHATDVVKWNDNVIILNTGGWFTNTTKTRMNQASNQYNLGYQVYQKAHKWHVNYKGTTHNFDPNQYELILER